MRTRIRRRKKERRGRKGRKDRRRETHRQSHLSAMHVTSSLLLFGSLTVNTSIPLTTNPGNDAILNAHCQLRAPRIKLKANARLYPM